VRTLRSPVKQRKRPAIAGLFYRHLELKEIRNAAAATPQNEDRHVCSTTGLIYEILYNLRPAILMQQPHTVYSRFTFLWQDPMNRIFLAGFLAFTIVPNAQLNAAELTSDPESDNTNFELCDFCESERDFIRFAKYIAPDELGSHVAFIGNTHLDLVYRISYRVTQCPANERNFDVTIDSAERQNKATEDDFKTIIRAIKD
jgi:hypothetical protein